MKFKSICIGVLLFVLGGAASLFGVSILVYKNFMADKPGGIAGKDIIMHHEATYRMPGKDIFVLSIDGGGIFGIIPAQIIVDLNKELSDIYKQKINGESPPELWEYFNTISGTSTGSIIAAGLSIDQGGGHALRPECILNEYKKDLFKINGYYRGSNWFYQSYDVARFLIKNDPIYKIDGVKKEIERIFPNKTMSNSLTYLVIPFVSVTDGGFSYATNTNVSFANYWFYNNHVAFSSDKTPVSKVIISSSSALPYFALSDFKIPLSYEIKNDSSQKKHTHEFVGADGGFYQNDPVFLSIAESRRKFGSNSNIHVVSLGTGLSPKTSYETMDDKFIYPVKGLGVLLHIVAGMMRSSSSVANEYFLTDPTIEYFRIDKALPSGFKENIADSSNENTKKIQDQADILSKSAHKMIHNIALELFESKFSSK
ncbi:patatin-like phospholipase family protein [Gluconobacter thailandicus]|uniref:PNPLA domain-containing protein n=1 Tax=Gluconobacter thailandicus TaxID=257438 RepID=A0AAP9EWV2_GLUTH|nr:patatin-like phospholipase family protein [Gluconobacter thailandicus]QEH97797.1 hypothetical protein FXF46_16000 [Gluconobacter thailandicus]